MVMRVAVKIVLRDDEEKQLEDWSSSPSSPERLKQRALIVLSAAKGMNNVKISAALGIDRNKVSRWRVRFSEMGLRGIEKELPRGPQALPKTLEARLAIANRAEGD